MKPVFSLLRERQVEVIYQEPLAAHTTWKIGGPADLLITPSSKSQLIMVLQILNEHHVPWMVMGKGSNLLVSDKGYRGAVITVNKALDYARIVGNQIYAGAGYSLIKLAALANKHRLSRLEFAGGIPGSVGGAVYMNAGANGSDISNIFHSAEVITQTGAIRSLRAVDMDFSYRHSSLQETDVIITEAIFELTLRDSESIKLQWNQYKEKRLKTQPLPFDCAGSVFRNPPGHFAAKLIEDAGLKGMRYGGAEVSSKHANFIMNTGNATALDVWTLMRQIQEKVHSQSGIHLVPEVVIVGEQ
ncbi:UDP-N-acetylenolpyruvoylglucosamine reductase [Brevibacillus formosus]|uniref:UDP-N-acetylenolpyruvoylglucosamine reductase n=1 Tax=Brevibacillus formosus TaxID=54913 RepID=A0A220MI70_9BACL|nr:UDP-N-acetylmuramate dehydrogenase [Brevibacillus formosus]ASJ54798.1 UDP-N-acetylenolpyruvoylglucosamine reductase [Brevibacillus formosus]